MNKKRSKFIYLILIFLIMLVIAVIGGLLMVLFNMTFPAPAASAAPPVARQTNSVEYVAPVSETIIEAKVPKPAPQKRPELEPEPEPTEPITPIICEGYGPQIKSRDAFKYPATYTASVSPTRVHFTVFPKQSAKQQK